MSERDYRAEAAKHKNLAAIVAAQGHPISADAHRIAAAVYEEAVRWAPHRLDAHDGVEDAVRVDGAPAAAPPAQPTPPKLWRCAQCSVWSPPQDRCPVCGLGGDWSHDNPGPQPTPDPNPPVTLRRDTVRGIAEALEHVADFLRSDAVMEATRLLRRDAGEGK